MHSRGERGSPEFLRALKSAACAATFPLGAICGGPLLRGSTARTDVRPVWTITSTSSSDHRGAGDHAFVVASALKHGTLTNLLGPFFFAARPTPRRSETTSTSSGDYRGRGVFSFKHRTLADCFGAACARLDRSRAERRPVKTTTSTSSSDYRGAGVLVYTVVSVFKHRTLANCLGAFFRVSTDFAPKRAPLWRLLRRHPATTVAQAFLIRCCKRF